MLNDTVKNMFADLGVDAEHSSVSLEQLSATNSKYLRDLKLNLSTLLTKSKALSQKEAYLLALSASANDRCEVLVKAFAAKSIEAGATEEEVSEAQACASLLSLNNVFYRFRHFMHGNEYYNNTPAGIRMSVMMSPAMGKEFFELMSLAVSALNGCQQCVASHEASVRQLGASEARVYDAVRVVSVVRSLCVLI
ncbi:MAG: carboxymuconolactone decarboxylase family protein [Chitinophagales bacterium]|nr:carboxymuconolactone decarboxylase family protein [Chitinophagaceae bacterium]MCB9064493.1 carboxymuconolactone decarboxylase family protein [Chitinophagales bacterium]